MAILCKFKVVKLNGLKNALQMTRFPHIFEKDELDQTDEFS